MSESMNAMTARRVHRRRLLTTVSALALLASACGARNAQAADGDIDQPVLWIGIGGSLNMLGGGQDAFIPPDLAIVPRPSFEVGSPEALQRGPRLGLDSSVSIAFQPSETDWILSASVRFGRARRTKEAHAQPVPAYLPYYSYSRAIGPYAFYEASARMLTTHLIVDFKAGRDVGLGMFGSHSSSVISLGMRYAHFDSTADSQVSSQPSSAANPANLLHATAHIRHAFNGVGPSISWDASAPVAGKLQDGSLWLDWGANAAILFGKQSVHGDHQTMGPHRITYANFGSFYTHDFPLARRHGRIVPNVGGYVSISYRLQDVKLSVGYRADTFFGAIDGGIDTPKNENRSFTGPFASVSIGVGN